MIELKLSYDDKKWLLREIEKAKTITIENKETDDGSFVLIRILDENGNCSAWLSINN